MFKISHKDKNARVGVLKTAHGSVETPFFMPVATKATVKHASFEDLERMKAKVIISNAFVLYLSRGLDAIEKFKGIHKFMKFKGVVFTDCGGFQVLRESFILNTDDEGILFKSPFDGKKILLTPKMIMDIESRVGSDVAMVLDDVVEYGGSYEKAKGCMKRTHKWAEECVKAHKNKKQLLFGICQGGFYEDLRKKSAKFVNGLKLDGMAIGGLCLGEPKDVMYKMLDCSLKHIDEEKPKYLMGTGSPEDLVKCISKGVDIFDSVFPTQNARHGTIFTWKGKLKIRNSKYKFDKKPLDEDCDCYVCKSFSRAYINYLMRISEHVYMRYTTYHNLYFMQRLMERVRKSIKAKKFSEFKKEFLKGYKQ
ncbi:tRNA guanosine(34) transglycosylase Tgt [Candidatus Woesearchaeota archaeon]|nr:tRNA guanosine(34) transglycosylase Tgt [Candidatus Woesearchaeota archaeon]|tara:strand:- start:6147 stop:7241 length:1095 start_codon:yes stop_codon:yes gene_type:complete